MSRWLRAVLVFAALSTGGCGIALAVAPLARLQPPPGFHVALYGEQVPNARALGAHVAPLGMRFYVGRMFPESYDGAILIAEHGSWNRSRKAGYRVVVVHVGADGKASGAQPFLTGFLDGRKTLGRPADVQPLRDGSLPVFDDRNSVTYRITHTSTK